MDLRIATAILLFLSLFLYATASDEYETKPTKVHKHSNVHKRRRHHKAPLRKSSDENVQEKLNKSEKQIAYNETNTTTEKPKDFINQTINSQENVGKEEIEAVPSAELTSQVEEPPAVSWKNDENTTKEEYVIEEKKEPLNETKKVVKEVIFINGVHDILKLLANIGLNALEKQLSQNESHKYIRVDPEEENNKTIESLKQFRKGAWYKAKKELLIKKTKESKNNSKEKQSKKKEINGEEAESKNDTIKENRRFGEQHKNSSEDNYEVRIQTNIIPQTKKKYKVVKDKNKSTRRNQKVTKNNGEDLQKSVVTEKNATTFHEKVEEQVVPTAGINRKNEISKSNPKIRKYIVTKTIHPSTNKQFKEEIMNEDLSKYVNSGESVEIEEHIYVKNKDVEPESVEKFIYIEDKNPALSKEEEESVTDKFGRKSGINTSSDDEQEKDNKKKKSPSQRQFEEESKEIIQNTNNDSQKQKTEKAC